MKIEIDVNLSPPNNYEWVLEQTTKTILCGIGVEGCDENGFPIRCDNDIDFEPDGSVFGSVEFYPHTGLHITTIKSKVWIKIITEQINLICKQE